MDVNLGDVLQAVVGRDQGAVVDVDITREAVGGEQAEGAGAGLKQVAGTKVEISADGGVAGPEDEQVVIGTVVHRAPDFELSARTDVESVGPYIVEGDRADAQGGGGAGGKTAVLYDGQGGAVQHTQITEALRDRSRAGGSSTEGDHSAVELLDGVPKQQGRVAGDGEIAAVESDEARAQGIIGLRLDRATEDIHGTAEGIVHAGKHQGARAILLQIAGTNVKISSDGGVAGPDDEQVVIGTAVHRAPDFELSARTDVEGVGPYIVEGDRADTQGGGGAGGKTAVLLDDQAGAVQHTQIAEALRDRSRAGGSSSKGDKSAVELLDVVPKQQGRVAGDGEIAAVESDEARAQGTIGPRLDRAIEDIHVTAEAVAEAGKHQGASADLIERTRTHELTGIIAIGDLQGDGNGGEINRAGSVQGGNRRVASEL